VDSAPANIDISEPILAGESETDDERLVLADIHLVGPLDGLVNELLPIGVRQLD
jgi:hypothetical protein